MITPLLTIAVLHWLVLFVPGANFVLVGQLAASQKRSTAVAASFGISTVTFLWASLAILGVGLLFAANPGWRQGLQLGGGIYLCYLGYKFWRSQGVRTGAHALSLTGRQAFQRGFFTNVLNPKTALFFGSVFATALPADAGPGLITAAVALVYLNSLVWHLVLAFLFSRPRVQSAYARNMGMFGKVSGVLVALFGLELIYHTVSEILSSK